MEILGERPAWSMSDSEKLLTLDAVNAEISRLQTYYLQVLADYDATGHAATLGAGDTARLLAFRHRLDPGVIRRDLQLAKDLHKYPAVTNALPPTALGDADSEPDSQPDGEPGGEPGADAPVVLSPAQAAAIVSALEGVPDTVAVEDLAVAEHQLVGLARYFNPSELRKAARRIRDLLDTDGPAPEEDKAYAREELRLKTADRGVKFSGYLANENAELFQALILDGSKPRKTVTGEPDPRRPDKRRADALTDILNVASNAITATTPADTTDPTDTTESSTGSAETAGNDAGTGTSGHRAAGTGAAGGAGAVAGHGPKAHVTITIDLKDLTDAGPHAVGTLVHGEGLSAGAIRRLACDAQIIPIVLGANSEPLDVGMSQRFVNRAMRRALNARDKGCVVCKAPPIFCDAHHLISWIDHGPTALTNLVLLCRRHHIDIHHGHWTITLHGGVVTVARPAWADPTPTRHRTRYRRPAHRLAGAATSSTPATTNGGARVSPSPAQNRTNHPPSTTTDNNPATQVDPWGNTDAAAGFELRGDTDPAAGFELRGDTDPAAEFDPWGDTDPPDPGSGEQTRPPDDPTPGRWDHHLANSASATTDD